MTTLEASPQQKTLARKLYEKRQAEIMQRRQEEIARVARSIAADRHEKERERTTQRVAPTDSRLAKGDVGQHIIAGEGRKFRTKSPVEHYSGQWPADVEQAFVRYIVTAHAKDRVSVTISYNGNGAGGSGGRLGGLGNVHDAVRDAYEEFHFCRDRMTQEAVQIMDWLVLELRTEATARAIGLEEVGQRLFPSIRDKATRRGIAVGALLMAGKELAKTMRLFAVLSGDRKREREMRTANP